MRVMVIVKATTDSEAGKMPSRELIEDMGKFNQKLIEAGLMVDGGGLKPTSKGARVALFRRGPHGDQGAVRQCRRARFGLLDLESEGPRRGDRLGQALPQSDAGAVHNRDPRVFGDGGFRLTAASGPVVSR